MERRIEHRSHAPRLAHEPGAAVRGEDAEREPVPAAQGDGAAAVPDARRRGQAAPEGPANGPWRHGRRTQAAMAERAFGRLLLAMAKAELAGPGRG